MHLIEAQSGKHIAPESAGFLVYAAGQLSAAIADGLLAVDKPSGAGDRVALRAVGNHPNPFNPSTQIEFTLGAASAARLDVFNIMGQRVRTLVDGDLEAGPHAVTWDGTNQQGVKVGSGIYLYRLAALGQTATGKMLMLK
jgi:hypothetical protein